MREPFVEVFESSAILATNDAAYLENLLGTARLFDCLLMAAVYAVQSPIN